MSYISMLPDRCKIQNRTLGTGKVKGEAWTQQDFDTPCRALFQTITSRDKENTQNATLVRPRFALPKQAVVFIRDRILHNGRTYDVIHVNAPFDATQVHHKVAVCEAVVGGT